MNCKLKRCCIVFGLKTGSLIIAYLGVIWNLMCLWMVIPGYNSTKEVASSDDINYSQKVKFDISILFWVLAIFFLSLMFNIILIIGLHTRKRGFIKAYLIYTFLFIVLGVGCGFVPSVIDGLSVLEIVQRSIIIALSIYFTIVIWSYWAELNDARHPIPNTAANKL